MRQDISNPQNGCALSAGDVYRAVGPADLDPGESRCVAIDGAELIVARGQDGRYHTVQRLCSHAALPLDGGRVRGGSIVCPHHGARFDLSSGQVLGPPASAPITAFPTRERDGAVEVLVRYHGDPTA